MSALREALARFPRLDLAGGPTPLDKLERLSTSLGSDLYVKRDDTTPFALGGNKVRKLEFLAADALKAGADTLVTAGRSSPTMCARPPPPRRSLACAAWRCWKTPSAPRIAIT